jgi:hypothetical protein
MGKSIVQPSYVVESGYIDSIHTNKLHILRVPSFNTLIKNYASNCKWYFNVNDISTHAWTALAMIQQIAYTTKNFVMKSRFWVVSCSTTQPQLVFELAGKEEKSQRDGGKRAEKVILFPLVLSLIVTWLDLFSYIPENLPLSYEMVFGQVFRRMIGLSHLIRLSLAFPSLWGREGFTLFLKIQLSLKLIFIDRQV